MERVKLKELNFKNRNEAVAFLKALWGNQKTPCPLCGHELEWLHKKAKKINCDWQCKTATRFLKPFICWMSSTPPDKIKSAHAGDGKLTM